MLSKLSCNFSSDSRHCPAATQHQNRRNISPFTTTETATTSTKACTKTGITFAPTPPTTAAGTTTVGKPSTSSASLLATTTRKSTTLSTTSSQPTAPTSTATLTIPSGSNRTSLFSQCGGLNWSGPKCCKLGYTCTAVNPLSSQCAQNPFNVTDLPYMSDRQGSRGWGSSSYKLTPLTLPPTLRQPACAETWAQCGGIGYSGPKCCKDGYTCAIVNAY
ncbi:hypothetical protein M427DRAFT_350980 [Gonapodya prolifera JEL478]|uniref:CBM1 domain-containing protein n=1 Tax=Gonapodya prolifera (strain JEL478) TaxID=1344416 RepID=A0A139AWC8_GONPJ|nr:hypothetical protein M427DRAFT_350980 [Gonapodya prolifera JEL478]|eukprot:KXS21042.1 hypothetical protein M427DRAFT_350980 [Gonapodya prolifera JEL478]